MRRLLSRNRTSLIGIALVAVLALVATATANRMIRDNTINSRDIRDNQVNTRDLRDGSITTRDIRDNQINSRDLRDGSIHGVDIGDGSIEAQDLSAGVASGLATTTLFDPRAHNTGACCLDWQLGPTAVGQVAPSASDPLPSTTSGDGWRSAVLEPGAYVVQTTAYVEKGAAEAKGVATRLFLGGNPVGVGGGYSFVPVSGSGLPETRTTSTAIQVPQGTPGQRELTERVISLGAAAKLSDNLLIWKVSPH